MYVFNMKKPLSRGLSRPLFYYKDLQKSHALTHAARSVRNGNLSHVRLKHTLRIPKPVYREMTSANRQLLAIAGVKTPAKSGATGACRPLAMFYQGYSRRELEALGFD